MLRRVIALLAAFAVLAERAAERSAPVRWLVLWLLRRAETAAAAYVFDESGQPAPPPEGLAAAGNARDDALRLAARFRALAEALCFLLPLACPFGRRPSRRGVANGPRAASARRHAGDWTRMPCDTS